MALATNWLSFSLSPTEMLRSSSSPPDHQQHQSQFIPYEGSSTSNHYFLDNFYSNGWSTTDPKEVGEASMLSSFMDPSACQAQTHHAPKLEDFLGDNSCQTEATQDDSSLTHVYDHHPHLGPGPASVVSYFNTDPQELKAIAEFQAFSGNSGSEVDDSASVVRAHPQLGGGAEICGAGHSIESVRSERELGFGNGTCSGATNGLSLCVSGVNASDKNNNTNNSYNSPQVSADKAIVVSGVEGSSDCSKKIVDTFGQRTSIYRGVTRHRWTGRYEAHLWDNSCRREGQARKGRQVYLGGYDKEDKAARAYDLAAFKYWGPTATTNFPVSNYSKELEEMKYVSKQEFIASLRRKSSGFSRGASIYRGVTRHHQQGRWQARIGRVAGNKDLYLGTFSTEEEAAEAYDIAAIKFRGLNAVTNFEMNRYDVEAIMKSALPIGGAAKRLKLSLEFEQKQVTTLDQQQECSSYSSNNMSFSSMQPMSAIPCDIPCDTTAAYYHQSLFHHFQPSNNLPGPSDPPSCPPSVVAPPMGTVPQTAELFVWPHHQSY